MSNSTSSDLFKSINYDNDDQRKTEAHYLFESTKSSDESHKARELSDLELDINESDIVTLGDRMSLHSKYSIQQRIEKVIKRKRLGHDTLDFECKHIMVKTTTNNLKLKAVLK